MGFKVEISNMRGAAFDDMPELEVQAILRNVAGKISDGLPSEGTTQPIYDTNGNVVGEWGWTRD